MIAARTASTFEPTPWPKRPGLAPPIKPMDTVLRYRAQSVLHGLVPDPLPATAAQALDVIRWHEATRPAS